MPFKTLISFATKVKLVALLAMLLIWIAIIQSRFGPLVARHALYIAVILVGLSVLSLVLAAICAAVDRWSIYQFWRERDLCLWLSSLLISLAGWNSSAAPMISLPHSCIIFVCSSILTYISFSKVRDAWQN